MTVENDPAEAPAALGDALCGAFEGSIDLDVVGEFARLPDARVERLASRFAGGASVLVQKVTALLRQSHNLVAPALDPQDLTNEAGLPEMPQVAATHVECPAVVIAKVAGGDHAERADRGERPALRPAKLVRAIAQRGLLSLAFSRQAQIAREHVARIERAIVLLAWTSTTSVGIEALPVRLASIVERVVSIEHRISSASPLRVTNG